MTFIILHNSVNVMFTFSPMFSFQKKKGKKLKKELIDIMGDSIWLALW